MTHPLLNDELVEKAAREIWHERARHFGIAPATFSKDERWELCLSYARAALSIAIPAVVQRCAQVADVHPGFSPSDYGVGHDDAALEIAKAIRSLAEGE
jgi:hypothetical protein